MHLLTSKTPRQLQAKLKLLGFELIDLLLIFLYLSISNLLFGQTTLKFPIVYLGSIILAITLYFTKKGKPDNYLQDKIQSLLKPSLFSANLQKKTDLTVAESFRHHNEAFKYAKNTDEVAQKMKHYAHRASQAGATKTLLEGQAVLIHTLNQILRTNAALLKIQTQQLALKNKNEKNQSREFQVQYSELSHAFKSLKPNYNLVAF